MEGSVMVEGEARDGGRQRREDRDGDRSLSGKSAAGKLAHSTVAKTRSISFDELAKHFYMPINDAAKELGICATVLKELCRRRGIQRWPHRKLKALDRLIEKYEREQTSALDQGFYQSEIRTLRQKKESILRHYRRRSPAESQSPAMAETRMNSMGMDSHEQNGIPTSNAVMMPPSYQGMNGDGRGMYPEYNPMERGEQQMGMHSYYTQAPPGAIVQMRQVGYYPPTNSSTGQMHAVAGPPSNMHMQQHAPPGVPGTNGGMPSQQPHTHGHPPPPHARGQMYPMNIPGHEMYHSQYVSCPPASHQYMPGVINSSTIGGYPYQPVPYGTVIYEGEPRSYPIMAYPVNDPTAAPTRNQQMKEPIQDWTPQKDAFKAAQGDNGNGDGRRMNLKSKEKPANDANMSHNTQQATPQADTIHTRQHFHPGKPNGREMDQATENHRNNEAGKFSTGQKQGSHASDKMRMTQLVQANTDHGIGQSGRSREGTKKRRSRAVDNSQDSVSGTEEPSTTLTPPAALMTESTPAAANGQGSDLPSSCGMPANDGAGEMQRRERSDPASASPPREDPPAPECSNGIEHPDFSRLLKTLQVTVWTMDTDTKCTSLEGPEVVAFHRDIPQFGETIFEQVERRTMKDSSLAARLLEPYVQARSGNRVERTFWNEGRKYLQIFTPTNVDKRMTMCPTSSLCLELATI